MGADEARSEKEKLPDEARNGSLSAISSRNSQSMGELQTLFGMDFHQLVDLIDGAWAQALESDAQLLDRALASGVSLTVAHEGKSASLRIVPDRKGVRTGKPLYVMYREANAAGTASTGRKADRGVVFTKTARDLLARFMPDMGDDEIHTLVSAAIERAEQEGRADTRWRPPNAREGQSYSSVWVSSGQDTDRDIRTTYVIENGVRKVIHVERQRAMKLLESFAFMGKWGDVLEELADMAMPEVWDEGDGAFGILKSYLKATYARIERQDKVRFSDDGHAAFNTGLKDRRGNDIVAVFSPNNKQDARQRYRFMQFVTPQGRDAARDYLPMVSGAQRATYVEHSSDLVMRWSDRRPILSEEHILIDRIDRLPIEFLRSVDALDEDWKGLLDRVGENGGDEEAYQELGNILEGSPPIYRNLLGLLRMEAERAFDDLRLYPYAALPIYNPERDALAFVLPIQLMSRNDRPNAALLVEEVGEGDFRAHTVLTMEMAYVDARVISPPKNSWLAERYSAEAQAIRKLREQVADLKARLGEGAAAKTDGSVADGDGSLADATGGSVPVGDSGSRPADGDSSLREENDSLKAAVKEMKEKNGALEASAETFAKRAKDAEEEAKRVRDDLARMVEERRWPEPAAGALGACDDEREGDFQATLYRDGLLVIACGADGIRELGGEIRRTLADEVESWRFKSADGFSTRAPAPWSGRFRDVLSVRFIGDSDWDPEIDMPEASWSMTRWFAELPNLKTASFEGVDLGRCTSLRQLFLKCESLERVEFDKAPIGPSTSVADMFVGCPRQIRLKLRGNAPQEMEGRLLAELALRNPKGTQRDRRADLTGLSWAQISRISSLIRESKDMKKAARSYGLSDAQGKAHPLKKRLTMGDGSAHDVVLTWVPSRESEGLTFMFSAPVASRSMMGDGLFAKASWGASDVRAWLNEEFVSGFPRDCAEVVVATRIGSHATGIEYTTDKVFLASVDDYPSAEQDQSPSAGREKGLTWLRDSLSAKCFCALKPGGKGYVLEPMRRAHDIRPCFCV